MKRFIVIMAVAIVPLLVSPAQANVRKITVQEPGNANTTMEVKLSTVNTGTVDELVTETITVNLAAADVMNTMTKAQAIVMAINMQSNNATAKVDANDQSTVIITSNNGRSISRVDPRPLKSGERDKWAGLGPADGENPNASVIVGVDLDGTGSVNGGTAQIDIDGSTFTVVTNQGEDNTSVLEDLKNAINMSTQYAALVSGGNLTIFGAVLGDDFSAFFTDAVGPGSLGYSYGFFVQSTPIPEPGSSLALVVISLIGFGAAACNSRRRFVMAP
ncbi:MAG: hypothetical protein AB7P78_20510 [Candidatus Binatia bacterium]